MSTVMFNFLRTLVTFGQLRKLAGHLDSERTGGPAKRAIERKMRSVVLIRGLLKGMEREALCEMLAMRESASETSPAVYSQCCVIAALPDVPDGLYTVSFSGFVVSARKEGGLWLPESATSPLQLEPRRGGVQASSEVEEVVEILPLLEKNHVA